MADTETGRRECKLRAMIPWIVGLFEDELQKTVDRRFGPGEVTVTARAVEAVTRDLRGSPMQPRMINRPSTPRR